MMPYLLRLVVGLGALKKLSFLTKKGDFMNTRKIIVNATALVAVLLIGSSAHLNAISGRMTNRTDKKVRVELRTVGKSEPFKTLHLEGKEVPKYSGDPERFDSDSFDSESIKPLTVTIKFGGKKVLEENLLLSKNYFIVEHGHKFHLVPDNSKK